MDVRNNAVEVLKRQLRRIPPGCAFTCSACDGWQQVEAHCQFTRRCCQQLLVAGFIPRACASAIYGAYAASNARLARAAKSASASLDSLASAAAARGFSAWLNRITAKLFTFLPPWSRWNASLS